ncbi:DNA-directed DNA polymerase [Mycoplasmopsis californica]|uniref:DNA polymerase III subunit delta n=1 Tax=Mycoplasmopsis equigenitalium TaxID=114883 RepID=A0ABY5J0Y1_9BACT|nr:hypothetical protein [Mycoplasmopsis equigenitalium]UUD36917.1 hypothetical protein NPA09_03395 [Mycoplasmopsis equigenitalium]VEU69788.1 DNA-directed DNA polymerase [Mycoplasmopsis californica]
MYVIYGEEKYLIEQKIQDIINQYLKKFDELDIDISKLGENTTEEDFLFEIQNDSLIFSQRIIVCDNLAFLLKNSKNKNITTQIIDALNRRKNMDFIFKFNTDKLDETNPIIQYLLKNSNVTVIKKLNERQLGFWIEKYVTSKNATISEKNIDTIIECLPHELLVISKELDKLISRNPKIEINPELDFPVYISNKPFAIQDHLQSKNLAGLLEECRKNLEIDGDTSRLIKVFSNFFTLASQYYCFLKAGFSDAAIQQITQINPHRLTFAKRTISTYGISRINNIIIELGKIEINSRTTSINRERWFDYFITKLIDIVSK